LFAAGQEQTTFSTDVKVVSVLATVHDKKGQIIRNLAKDDFTLQEDDRPQVIRYFSQETNLPLTLGLLVDTSLSQRRVLGQERTASYRFLEQVLRPDKDMAFVIHFDREIELLKDLTSSKKELESALDKLETPQLQSQQQGGGAVATVAEDSRSNSVRTERKFWNRFRDRRAAVSLKSRRSSRSSRFTTAFKKSCATSTAWDTRPTARMRARGSVKSASR
jgi:VWFA-related protein